MIVRRRLANLRNDWGDCYQIADESTYDDGHMVKPRFTARNMSTHAYLVADSTTELDDVIEADYAGKPRLRLVRDE